MADDDRPDERDPEVGAVLAVEPLDEVTRRRLVATALAEAGQDAAGGRSRAWRWVAAAAAVVIVAVGGLALVTAEGGHDEQRAASPVPTQERADAGAATGSAATASAGDFGDLDVAANLAALRAALLANPAKTPTSDEAPSPAQAGPALSAPCVGGLPAGTVLAVGTGTLDGRSATVVLTRLADGSRSFDALLTDPCEVRHLV